MSRNLRVEEVVGQDYAWHPIYGVIQDVENLKIGIGNIDFLNFVIYGSEYNYVYNREEQTIICTKEDNYDFSIIYDEKSLRETPAICLPAPSNWPDTLKEKIKEMLINIFDERKHKGS